MQIKKVDKSSGQSSYNKKVTIKWNNHTVEKLDKEARLGISVPISAKTQGKHTGSQENVEPKSDKKVQDLSGRVFKF